ncbi:hypothetical protein PVAP13_9KG523752 [Panicum virgatum]|uniref:Uncharacterized protein n=1 Tax=Panicum virgatum TaxID=38727 RepID=A0A8T0P271_PANVG|nr:hypothetical protein PVAP13_9KG523752 [Panicum virgatum]
MICLPPAARGRGITTPSPQEASKGTVRARRRQAASPGSRPPRPVHQPGLTTDLLMLPPSPARSCSSNPPPHPVLSKGRNRRRQRHRPQSQASSLGTNAPAPPPSPSRPAGRAAVR